MATAGKSGDSNISMTEEEVLASTHYPVLSEITNDKVLLEKWCRALQEYKYIDSMDDIEEGEIIRYIDIRKIPLKLSNPFKIVKLGEEYIRIGILVGKPLFWTINQRFCIIFQKRSFKDKLLAAVEKLENKYRLTE
jgi:hypothetical protein